MTEYLKDKNEKSRKSSVGTGKKRMLFVKSVVLLCLPLSAPDAVGGTLSSQQALVAGSRDLPVIV